MSTDITTNKNYNSEFDRIEDLIEKLKKAFGIGDDENPTIDELLDIAAEYPSIYIHLWEYASLFDMF